MLKLVYPTSRRQPDRRRFAGRGDLNPLDTNLDGRLFPSTNRAGIVTFEPFAGGVDWFEILLEVPKKGQPDTDTVRIRVTSPTMSADVTACLAGPTSSRT